MVPNFLRLHFLVSTGMEQRKHKQRLAQQIFASQQQLVQLSFNAWQQGSKQSKVGAVHWKHHGLMG